MQLFIAFNWKKTNRPRARKKNPENVIISLAKRQLVYYISHRIYHAGPGVGNRIKVHVAMLDLLEISENPRHILLSFTVHYFWSKLLIIGVYYNGHHARKIQFIHLLYVVNRCWQLTILHYETCLFLFFFLSVLSLPFTVFDGVY